MAASFGISITSGFASIMRQKPLTAEDAEPAEPLRVVGEC
jgi:hypothetical protein